MRFSTTGRWKIQCVDASDMDAITHLTLLDYPLHPRHLGTWDRTIPENVTPIHGGDRANVFKVNVGGSSYCVKVFHDKRCHVRVRNFMGHSKARRAFRNGLRLEELGISVPETVALSKDRLGGPQIVVTRFIGNGKTLRTNMQEGIGNVESLLSACAEFTRKLAKAGVLHIDYGARNILLDGTRLLLIDLEDVTFSGTDSRILEEDLRREFLKRMKRNALSSEGY